ncbi:hypothetical protein EEZ25_22150 [Micromonospora aurantiaca]|uniref:hypothetical protein n=1 Tax=Micromonospora aurantiaca (nom. illeg.) TaxID=47850 RepID=UPI000F3BF25A|nr:hypothetical protein [Micromonospora aurantiaca]RNH99688.1 hypothetical protein EEZ25_22150 [Micromonospora aurantiaca]
MGGVDRRRGAGQPRGGDAPAASARAEDIDADLSDVHRGLVPPVIVTVGQQAPAVICAGRACLPTGIDERL